MSPASVRASAPAPGFPRVSGDEPLIPTSIESHVTFSPRERG